MGRASTKEDKNMFQIAREDLGLTREAASELLEIMTADRIQKIESGRCEPHPDEVLLMEKGYKKPGMCNQYCSQECPIGNKYVAPIQEKDLTQITLEMLASLNTLQSKKDRFIEIAADGVIEDSELVDFVQIKKELDKISAAVDSLRLWIDTTIIDKGIDEKKLKEIEKKN